jgi:predicted dithiol-disulfide oxidoreductase (DUF899 family)
MGIRDVDRTLPANRLIFEVRRDMSLYQRFRGDMDAAGQVFHTYSCYARGLDMLNAAYHYLDLVPKGRDEDALPYNMSWVRHHDRYEA